MGVLVAHLVKDLSEREVSYMKFRLTSLFALLALTCFVALGADVDGKWMSEAQGKRGPQTLTLKASGDKLTGTIEGGQGGPTEISEGMVHGNDVMFKVNREFNGNKVTQEYKGTVAGSDLKLTVSGGQGAPRDVMFKKQ
jgi:hypothetical protein